MKALCLAALASVGLDRFRSRGRRAADDKDAAVPENCFASLWADLDLTAADCPLSYGPFTLYATLDAGLMYNTNGAPWSPAFVNGTQGLISKQSNGPKWLWSPNNINQSVSASRCRSRSPTVGRSSARSRRASIPFPATVELAACAGDEQRQTARASERERRLKPRRPTGQFAILPRLEQQDLRHAHCRPRQRALARRSDCLRSDGQRLRLLAVRFHRHVRRFRDTELARSNTAIKYRGEFGNFRVAGLAQVGGYNQGNGSTQMWQGQVGTDFHNLYGGTLSLDFVGSYAVDGA